MIPNILDQFKTLISLIVIFYLSVDSIYCQNKQTVDSIQSFYQDCLDKGQFMSSCSKSYYRKMDSLLIVVYNKLRFNIDSIEKAQLRKEQREWLLKRNNYFKKIQNEYKKDKQGASMPQDDIMEMYDKYAMFVQERVLYLIETSEKIKIK